MCRPRSSPIAPIIVAESAATARPSIRAFQTFVVGKIGHKGASGTVGAAPGSTGGGGGGGGAGGGGAGWLDAFRGFVPARYSAPSGKMARFGLRREGFVVSRTQ